MRARLMDSGEMLACGLLSEVTADEASLLPRAQAVAEEVAELAPLTLWATKEALRRGRGSKGPRTADSDPIVPRYISQNLLYGPQPVPLKPQPPLTPAEPAATP